MKILFIDIDTLRPDHMGCYGYQRKTTPNMDKVAQSGVVFENYYCSDAPCLPSRAALISGMLGIHNGAVGHGGTCADRRLYGSDRPFRDLVDDHNLNNIFRKAGMHTASISTFAERHSAWWFNAGFHETYNVGKGGMESGEEVVPVALNWIENNAQREDWFLHLHLWDPHTPYRAPASFGNPFEDEPLYTWITEEVFHRHLEKTGPHGLRDLNMYNDREFSEYPRQPGKVLQYSGLRRIIDGYDCGIRYADYLIGQVLDALREKNLMDDVAVIITSDHGENMGELGIYSEHATADHGTCNIPMIIKWPGGKRNIKDSGLHYSVDLLPTLSDLLSIDKYEEWDGRSFAKTITEGEAAGRDSIVISQMAHVCQRSARFGDWLYMRTYHDGYHLFDDEMLFNLKGDPYEQNDVKEQFPQICAEGAKIILDWHDENMKKSKTQTDPLWTVLNEGGPFHTKGNLERYLSHLEKTGRSEGAKKLRDKYMRK